MAVARATELSPAALTPAALTPAAASPDRYEVPGTGVLLDDGAGGRLELRDLAVLRVVREARAVEIPLVQAQGERLQSLLSESLRRGIPLEIEDRFRCIARPPQLDEVLAVRIEEGFLAKSWEPRAFARLRRTVDGRTLTFKHGPAGRARELEVSLSADQFDALWPLVGTSAREKWRSEIEYGRWRIQVDELPGARFLAEIEHASAQEQRAFRKALRQGAPAWLGPSILPQTPR